MNANSRSKRALPADSQVEVQRRKVRKGTQSCWECKRRKVRCNFATSTDSVCEGCKNRQTTCLSQEFPDHPANVDPRGRHGKLYDRFARLEAYVGRIAAKVDVAPEPDDVEDPIATENGGGSRGGPLSSSDRTHGSSTHETPPALLQERLANLFDWHVGASKQHPHDKPQTTQYISPALSLRSADLPRETASMDMYEIDTISRVLLAAWPSLRELNIIVELPSEITGLLHDFVCATFTSENRQRPSFVRERLELPPPGSHPVLLARKLLMLATFLQSLSPSCTRLLDQEEVDYRAIMSRAVATAHRWVTGNDDLLESIEGVECLMVETLYLINAGNLRKAWHLIRRAMLIAQMMGLNRGIRAEVPRTLDPETASRVEPEFAWFRLMQMNRYLSMMLGMLQGTPSNSFADFQSLERCNPTERMRRLDCAAGGYIMQRNEEGLYDTATTKMIDQQLQKSAALLPSSWWAVHDLSSTTEHAVEMVEIVFRTLDQLTHYHLISQLHLPHLVRPHTDHEYDYSKTRAVDASREILLRFTSLNGEHSFRSYCRGVSFLALIACTIICIVHIDAKRQRRDCTAQDGALLDLLAKEHERDRSMMELTLQCMQNTANECRDAIASKTAFILSHLLSIEPHAALRGKYVVQHSSKESERGTGCDGNVSDGGHVLHIHIPYIGTIRLERGTPAGLAAESGLSGGGIPNAPGPRASDTGILFGDHLQDAGSALDSTQAWTDRGWDPQDLGINCWEFLFQGD